MTATNHVLIGAVLGAVLPLPVAIPLAFASHFVMDALPHYGIPHERRDQSTIYRRILYIDSLAALVCAWLMILWRHWAMAAGALAAYAPDITWLYHYFRRGRSLHIIPTNWFMRFHRRIQRYERPWGIMVELIVAAILVPIFVQQLLR